MSRFANHLPQSALDRYAAEHPEEALQATASAVVPSYADAGVSGMREGWRPGDRAHFEYHCLESPESSDAEAWYRSHRPVTVLGPERENQAWGPEWEGSTLDERASEGMPRSYRVRHDDGFEHPAWEDELLTSPQHFHRPDPPTR